MFTVCDSLVVKTKILGNHRIRGDRYITFDKVHTHRAQYKQIRQYVSTWNIVSGFINVVCRLIR